MAFLALDALRHWKEKAAELRERWRGVREQNERLRRENDRLRQEREQWEQERERLEQERERLERERGRLERERERLRQENEKLKKQLEEAQRAAKRQAAPFSRGTRNLNPKPPGRKSGSAYGQHRRKAIPKRVDEVIAVPAPTHCDCGGETGSGKDRVAVSARNCTQDDLAPFRYSHLPLPQVQPTGARARSAADFRCLRSSRGADRSGGLGLGGADE